MSFFWGGWLTEAAKRNNGRKLRFYGVTFRWVGLGVIVGVDTRTPYERWSAECALKIGNQKSHECVEGVDVEKRDADGSVRITVCGATVTLNNDDAELVALAARQPAQPGMGGSQPSCLVLREQ